jgi:hypothetical protein
MLTIAAGKRLNGRIAVTTKMTKTPLIAASHETSWSQRGWCIIVTMSMTSAWWSSRPIDDLREAEQLRQLLIESFSPTPVVNPASTDSGT